MFQLRKKYGEELHVTNLPNWFDFSADDIRRIFEIYGFIEIWLDSNAAYVSYDTHFLNNFIKLLTFFDKITEMLHNFIVFYHFFNIYGILPTFIHIN